MRLRGFSRASVARVPAREKCNNAGQQHSARTNTTIIMLFIAPRAYCAHVGCMVVCHLLPACPQLALCKIQKKVLAGARTVPRQCPDSALTVPRPVPRQCPDTKTNVFQFQIKFKEFN